jgi:hypothetical protein
VAVEQGEHHHQHHDGEGGDEQLQDVHEFAAPGDVFREGVEKGPGGQSRDRGEKQDRAQRQDRPVEDDAHEPGAAAAHAPDFVEGILDRREELQHDDDERDGADRAGGAVARAGHEAVDELDELGVDLDVVGRGPPAVRPGAVGS